MRLSDNSEKANKITSYFMVTRMVIGSDEKQINKITMKLSGTVKN